METSSVLVHEGECRIPPGYCHGKELLPVSGRETFEERCRGNYSHKQDEAFSLCFCHCSCQMGKVRKEMAPESIYGETIPPILGYLTRLFRGIDRKLPPTDVGERGYYA